MTHPSTSDEVRLPTFFSDHMVLQRDAPVPVWGWARTGESVTVRLGGQVKTAVADEKGEWRVRFDALSATVGDAAPLTLEAEGRNRVVCEDVLVGEVWLCSGQSNMEWPVSMARDAEKEIAAADNPRVRQFHTPRFGSPEPQDASFLKTGSWKPASPETVGDFTAVGYFFAREVSRALGGMPVGLLDSSWGGTAIQSWMPVEAFQAVPGRHEALRANEAKKLADWPARLRQIEADTAAWEERAAAVRAAGLPEPPDKPWNPGPPNLPEWTPTNLYNGMIRPLIPYAMRGVLWYQGESNAENNAAGAREYTGLQIDLIRHWRGLWDAGEFPFYYVQLTHWKTSIPSGVTWAYFRDGQRRVLEEVPNTGMAVTIDVGDSLDIHPRDKQTVGQRLARLALRRTYGQPVVDQGPVFRAMRPDGAGGARVEFDGAEGGLVAKDGAPRHFAVAGADRKFFPAQAVVQGEAVVLTCPQVTGPVAAVRYAWTDDPAGANLYNGEGLPAMPFRTDDW